MDIESYRAYSPRNLHRPLHNLLTIMVRKQGEDFLVDDDFVGSDTGDIIDVEGGAESQHEEVVIIVKDETNAAVRFKLVVSIVLVLVLSAVAVALSVYFCKSKSEETHFQLQFTADSNKIFEAIGTNLDKTLGSYDSLSVALVSHARSVGAKWPFVTLPDFAIRVLKLLPLSETISIAVLPIVTPVQRLQWEEYARKNNYWVNESIRIQETWKEYSGPVIYDWQPTNEVHGDFDVVPYNET